MSQATEAQVAAAALVIQTCAATLDASPVEEDALLAAKAMAWCVRHGHAPRIVALSVEHARELLANVQE